MALSSPRPKTAPAKRLLPGAFSGRLDYQKKPPRYRDPATGRYLSPLTVRGIVDDEIDAAKGRLRAHGQALQNGGDLNAWRERVASEIKLLHLAQVAAAKGGFASLTQADYGNVTRAVRRQFRYLENFARELDADPTKAMGDGFLNRLSLYGEASRESYEEAFRQENKDAGMKFERNILHARESCHARKGKPGCADLAVLGWVPVGTLPAVGRRACFARCKCTLEYAPDLPATAGKDAIARESKAPTDPKELPDYNALLQNIETQARQMKERGENPRAVFAFCADQMRQCQREVGVALEPNGTFLFSIQGQQKEINNFSNKQLTQLKNAVFIHNHPSGLTIKSEKMKRIAPSFSSSDLDMMLFYEIGEIVAVTPNQTFRMSADHASISKRDVSETLTSFRLTFQARYQKELKAQGSEQADWVARHETLKRLAKNGKIAYEVGEDKWP